MTPGPQPLLCMDETSAGSHSAIGVSRLKSTFPDSLEAHYSQQGQDWSRLERLFSESTSLGCEWYAFAARNIRKQRPGCHAVPDATRFEALRTAERSNRRTPPCLLPACCPLPAASCPLPSAYSPSSPRLPRRVPSDISHPTPTVTLRWKGWSVSGIHPTSPQPRPQPPLQRGCPWTSEWLQDRQMSLRIPNPWPPAPALKEGALDGASADSRMRIGVCLFSGSVSCGVLDPLSADLEQIVVLGSRIASRIIGVLKCP